MMQQRPDFTFTQSSAAYYDWMQKLYPQIFSGIQQRVRDGRWEIVGGMWVEPDCNIPSGESWARHLLYGKRYFRKNLSSDVKIGWNPDSFGYNWNMPAFYKNAGIDAFITQKIGWNDTNVFPYRLFWWEAADGSRILSYFPFDYVNTVEDPFELVDWVRQYEANTGLTKLMILFGVGDHGGGPSLEMLARIDQLQKLDIYPTIEHGTSEKYLTWVRSHDLSSLPVWKDELYLEYHQGTFTTQAQMKELNRKEETLLTNAEKFSSIATLSGKPYPAGPIQDAWQILLFNQFHDILPGSSIREVYIDARPEHMEAQRIGTFELNGALRHLAQQINTSKSTRGTPLVIFNPLSWERMDIARIQLAEGDTALYAVFDPAGKEILSQRVQKERYQREILFVARSIPPLGYSVYDLRKMKPSATSTTLKVSESLLESEKFKISIDAKTGWIAGITDKRAAREILAGPGNRLQLLQDLPSAWDAWNLGLTGVEYPTTFRGATVIENGPVRATIRLHRDYLKPGKVKEFPTEDFPTSFFDQDIVLYDGLDRIDFVTAVDWWEDKTMLKVAFPLAVTDTAATYEIPYGTIRRSTQMNTSKEKGQVEVPASRWADLSSAEYGISLLNASKYGYDIKGNVVRLSLLRSPLWPDPTADRGKHSISYSVYPHQGSWVKAQTVQRGYEINTPLLTVLTDRHAGSLDAKSSFAKLTPAPLVLTAIKKAEDSDAWIVQWYNPAGNEEEAVLTLPKAPRKALLTNFLEEDGEPLATDGKTIRLRTGRHAITTVKVTF